MLVLKYGSSVDFCIFCVLLSGTLLSISYLSPLKLQILFFFIFSIGSYGFLFVRPSKRKVAPPLRLNLNSYEELTTRNKFGIDVGEFDSRSKFMKHGCSSDISNELDSILQMIIESFVMSWFERIDSDKKSKFVLSVQNLLTDTIIQIQKRLVSADVTKMILLKFIPLITEHLNVYSDSKQYVLRSSEPSDIDLQVAVEFNKRRKVHSSLSLRATRHEQEIESYVKKRIAAVLLLLVDRKEMDSPLVSILLRDIVTSSVFMPLISKFSSPDEWNMRIIDISQNVLEERHRIHEVRKILVKEIAEQDNQKWAFDLNSDSIDTPNFQFQDETSSQKFEEYLKSLSVLNNITLLKYQLFLLLTLVSKFERDSDLKKINNIEYSRIILSLNLVETKLNYLQQNDTSEGSYKILIRFISRDLAEAVSLFNNYVNAIKLEDISNDKANFENFNRFLINSDDKSGKILMDYCEVIEGMKNPLEDVTENDLSVTYSNLDILDLKDVIDSFFVGEKLNIIKALDADLVENILLFSTCSELSNDTYILCRKSMLILQGEAKRLLANVYFQQFKTTNEFLKMIALSNFTYTSVYNKYFELNLATGQNLNTRKVTRSKSNSKLNKELEKLFESGAYNESSMATTSTPIHLKISQEESNQELYRDFLKKDEPLNMSKRLISERIPSINHNLTEVNIDNKRGDSYNTIKDELADLTMSIDRIEKEMDLLNHLILKANLTDNQNQLKLLKKSWSSLSKELNEKELSKQQYLIKEKSNRIYLRTKVTIKSYYTDSSNDGGTVTYYLINVNYLSNGTVKTWEIPRRFSEFVMLNSHLKQKHKESMKEINKRAFFPSKVSLALKYQVSRSSLYEDRKKQLEVYMLQLLNIPEICDDDTFRSFLTSNSSLSIESPKSVLAGSSVDGKNEIVNQGSSGNNGILENSSNLDVIKSAETQNKSFDETEDGTYVDSIGAMHEAGNTSNEALFENMSNKNLYRIDSKKPFIKPICDLFIAIFRSDKKDTTWIRGRAILTILKQLLGSTIDKYVKEHIKKLESEKTIYFILTSFKNKMWGKDGILERKHLPGYNTPRNDIEILKTRNDSLILLQKLFIELSGKVVGLTNAKVAAIRIHGMLQNPYLNASLLLEILDIILNEIIFKKH